MQKLSYCILKSNSEKHIQNVPKINQIDELKENKTTSEKKNYSLGSVQITDETFTSQECPICFYYNKCSYVDRMDLIEKLKNMLNTGKLLNDYSYTYSKDGVSTIRCGVEERDLFIELYLKTRQNETKSHDFIRCIHCGFDSRLNDADYCETNNLQNTNHEKLAKITSGDTLAAYNIAKRGLELISKL